MPNPIPVVKPLLKQRKFKKTLKEVEKEREAKLEDFESKGFEDKASYKAFLDQRDKSRAKVYAKAQKLKESEKNAKQIEEKFGKDSVEAEFASMANPASAYADFEKTLLDESKKLEAVSPASLKKGKSKAKVAAVGVGVAAAAGVGAYVALNQMQKDVTLPDAPEIVLPEKLEIPVTNPYEPQMSENEIENIIETNLSGQYVGKPEIEEKVVEMLSSKTYQQQVEELAAKTNQKLAPLIEKIDESYQNLEDFLTTDCANITEFDITGKKGTCGGVNGFVRDLDDNLVSFCVKTLQECECIQETDGPRFIDEFTENFPNLTKAYHDRGIEINVQNIFYVPSDSGFVGREYRDIAYEDFVFNGHKYSIDEFLLDHKYDVLANSFTAQEQVNVFIDKFKSLATDEQLSEFEKLYNESDSNFREYFATVDDYNQAIKALQQEYFESLSADDFDMDLLVTNMLVDDKAQDMDADSTFEDILNHIQETKASKPKVSEVLDSVADDAVDAVSQVLDDTLSM